MILQQLQGGSSGEQEQKVSPLMNLFLCHVMGLLLAPYVDWPLILGRKSDAAAAGQRRRRAAAAPSTSLAAIEEGAGGDAIGGLSPGHDPVAGAPVASTKTGHSSTSTCAALSRILTCGGGGGGSSCCFAPALSPEMTLTVTLHLWCAVFSVLLMEYNWMWLKSTTFLALSTFNAVLALLLGA